MSRKDIDNPAPQGLYIFQEGKSTSVRFHFDELLRSTEEQVYIPNEIALKKQAKAPGKQLNVKRK